jgi:hypothetical protein
MDILDEELLKFWKALNDHHVRYIMIGGFAIAFHGFARSTEDLDIWLDDTLENRKSLRRAFIYLQYGDYPSLETMPFVPGWTDFRTAGGIRLYILTEMKGLEDATFLQSLHMASVADINGVKVPFLHINQLIENKKVVNRPKDQIDVIELERIRKIRESES